VEIRFNIKKLESPADEYFQQIASSNDQCLWTSRNRYSYFRKSGGCQRISFPASRTWFHLMAVQVLGPLFDPCRLG
jgi:hypothetical protein